MTDLNSLLASKASLKRVVERYRAKLALAQRELDEIEDVLSIVKKYGGDISDSVSMTPKTVGDMATELLKEHPEGLTSLEILQLIRERWMPELMRSSISPPLSRLKHMGIVELDDSVWRLTQNTSEANAFKSGSYSIQISMEAQKIAEESLRTIMQRQHEILAQIIQSSTVPGNESMDIYGPKERLERSAEMVRKTYERMVSNCSDAAHDKRIEPCQYTSPLFGWTTIAPDSCNLNRPSEIVSSSRGNGEYRRKRAL